jgi:hypothetical protein
LGWYISGKVLKRTSLSARQMKLFEWLLPVAKLVERLPLLPHLSVIAVGRKPLATDPSRMDEDLQERAWPLTPRELVLQD